MAGESYYLLFSIAAVLLAITHIINIIWFRVRKETIFGEARQPDSLGYKKFKALSSSLGFLIAGGIVLITIANLTYSVRRILQLPESTYPHGMAIYAPLYVTIFYVIMLLITRSYIMSKNRSSKR